MSNLATVTDRKGQTTTYQYDVLDRPSVTTYHGGTTSSTYTFDAGDRLTQVVDTVSGTITRGYNGLDLLTSETTPQGSVTYTYDNASRRATMTVAGQTQIVYGFDDADRLQTITQGGSQVTIGYDTASRRTTVSYPNGNNLVYGYNDANDLTSVTYKQGATVLGDLTYSYDLAGRRTTIGGTFARANLPPALTTTTYNANNQQTVFGTNTLNYDLNGNLNTVTDASGTSTYTWNVRNQLTGLSATGFSASFIYDAFGRRTGKTIQGTTTNFVYDGLNPVQEKNGATVTANLLTGLAIDEFFTRTDGAGVRSLLPDALGSTVALGDNTGTPQTQYTYEPFGFTSQTGVASTSSYRYTGREDDGSGLMYYRARYYHPRLQRFISEDPIGFSGGDVNLYAYVRNNPLLLRDPLGLAAGDIWDFWANYYRARQIADEELRKHRGHNDCDDAIRHADWNRRMTEELGYWYALAFGIGHEIEGLVQGQPLPEIRMDLHNNSVGRDSAGGPINQGNLQTSPGSGFGLPYTAGAGSSYPY